MFKIESNSGANNNENSGLFTLSTASFKNDSTTLLIEICL